MATGTDRPIYSSQGSKCIGLKKSLVFYKGRAAKGIKTDWMMHEFRLPSVSDSVSPKKYLDKNIPANEAWAICRIFKKANSSTQRALSHSWISPVFDTTISDMTMNPPPANNIQFSSSSLTMSNKTNSLVFCNDIESSIASFSPIHFPPCKPAYQMGSKPCQMPSDGVNLTTSSTISSTEMSRLPAQNCAINDASSLLLDMPSNSIFGEFVKGSENVDFGTFHEQCNGFSATVAENLRQNLCHGEEAVLVKDQNVEHLDDQWGTIRSVGYPCSYPLSLPDAWKSNLLWDSSPCPSELSTSYSTNKCYT
ncbi:UNVERIFIED_CONTAM: protein FEZ [Sesamum latifolium]|uniref:Protein FEZ n=1 Tax=Sesamum latifolium TaxID=2727402 RepID=A0AAW2WYR2_9LAMI